jgi:hypothetical protein
MRSALLKAGSLALLCLHTASAARAGVDVRTVYDDNGHVVVQFDNHQPPNFAPLVQFFVAISHTGAYGVTFSSGPGMVAGKAGTGQAVAALDTVTLSSPFPFRGARVIWVRVQIPPFTPVSHVDITYAPAARVASAATVDPLVREMVVNQSVFPLEATTGAPEAWFSRGAGWAKLTVADRGVYAVSGSDLTTAGINITAIDPNSLRLFTQGGRNQPRELLDPSGSWQSGQAMREVAVRVESGGDGTFDPGDRVIFYGVSARDWLDYYDPAAADTLFHEHTHTSTNCYYLAWGGTFAGAPRRMADVDAAPVAAPDRISYTHREYRERDLISDFDYRGDGWLWLDIDRAGNSAYGLGTVTVNHLVASVPQELLSLGLAPYDQYNDNHHAVFRRAQGAQEVVIGGRVWSTQPGQRYYEDGVPIRIAGNFLLEGDNTIKFQVPGDLNPNDEQLFAWFALRYERRIIASGDAVAFSTPDTTGLVNMFARGFSNAGTLYAFDVTDAWTPARLTGGVASPSGGGRSLRVGFALDGRRHLWAGTSGAFRRPSLSRLSPVELRTETTSPNMLIITHRDMRSAADRLRSFRAGGRVPLFPGAAVKVVTTDEVYDNFSGGMPDPMAIRNYIKYLFDNFPDANGNPRLGYVLLLGDATEDFRNYASVQPDFVPSNLYFTRNTLFAFSTDEWFGQLDAGDQVPGHGVLDVALGRLPAASAEEAALLVDKVIGYETQAPRDDWRHRMILVADDENSSFQFACETQWTDESELVARFFAPEFLDIEKIYLTEYPSVAGVKPSSRFAFLEQWNRGALLINYIGHGSSVQMADEQVFLGSDVSQLVNGLRLPALLAFSCTIGDFANPAGKSLSEKLLLREEGGAIATITASRETYPNPNERICFSLFEEMFPRRLGEAPVPFGVALMHAKLFGQVDTQWQSFQEENTWKYNLMCDPALRPATPAEDIHFLVEEPETLVAGVRHTLRGTVRSDGAPDTGFNGPVTVTVREPAIRRSYRTTCAGGITVNYLLPGGPIYQGTVDAVDGEFEVSFRVPRYTSTGTLAYAGAYARDDARDAATSMDSLLTVVPPTLADSLALKPVDGAPRVNLGFKSGLQVVKPGDTVQGKVADADGINILNTTNEGRQAILIDNLPVPIDANGFFSFDHGGIDTSGVLLYPLPDLSVGSHRLVYKVSDSFGFTTLDTLRFEVTDAANYYAEPVFNYPNPFRDSTRFLFRISNRASVRLELFTVSGKFVRRIEETHEGGEVWVQWDGRDAGGGEVANGSYLYVATIDFVGVDRPAVVLRGALSRVR